jgi:hypothetical protein
LEAILSPLTCARSRLETARRRRSFAAGCLKKRPRGGRKSKTLRRYELVLQNVLSIIRRYAGEADLQWPQILRSRLSGLAVGTGVEAEPHAFRYPNAGPRSLRDVHEHVRPSIFLLDEAVALI